MARPFSMTCSRDSSGLARGKLWKKLQFSRLMAVQIRGLAQPGNAQIPPLWNASRILSDTMPPLGSSSTTPLVAASAATGRSLAVRQIDCRPRAAVVMKIVSADSLRKTGIFADKAGDFRRFPP
jgi:hypothetical protein